MSIIRSDVYMIWVPERRRPKLDIKVSLDEGFERVTKEVSTTQSSLDHV